MSDLPAGVYTAFTSSGAREFIIPITGMQTGTYDHIREFVNFSEDDYSAVDGLAGSSVLPSGVLTEHLMTVALQTLITQDAGAFYGHYDRTLFLIRVVNKRFGSFRCDAAMSFMVDSDVITNRFFCDAALSAVFIGEPHVIFHVDCTSSRSFNVVGKRLGTFTCDCVAGRSFVFTPDDAPRFRVDVKTSVIFYIRGGQSPDCYYDNALQFADATRNYVF